MNIISLVNSQFEHSFNNTKNKLSLKTKWIDTLLGPMIVIADEKALYLLEFAERRNLANEVKNLVNKTKANIIDGECEPINSITKELGSYFAGTLREFKTPYYLLGSDFQKIIWQGLAQIPYGQTRSYLDQAKILNKPGAVRATANANGKNQLAIIIPCHRVINTNGKLGGYGGGIDNKKWLLEHETKFCQN